MAKKAKNDVVDKNVWKKIQDRRQKLGQMAGEPKPEAKPQSGFPDSTQHKVRERTKPEKDKAIKLGPNPQPDKIKPSGKGKKVPEK